MLDEGDPGLMLWVELLRFLPCVLCGRESEKVLWLAQYYTHYGKNVLERRMAWQKEVCESES